MPASTLAPATVAEVLDDNYTFTPEALAAVKALARSKPWRGTREERLAKLNACAAALAEAYGHPVYTVVEGDNTVSEELREVRVFRLSVVSFLHLMAAARGLKVRTRFAWSINLFRRCFPLSYSRCVHVGPLLTRPDLHGEFNPFAPFANGL